MLSIKNIITSLLSLKNFFGRGRGGGGGEGVKGAESKEGEKMKLMI